MMTCQLCDNELFLDEEHEICAICQNGYSLIYSRTGAAEHLGSASRRMGRIIHGEDDDAVERDGEREDGVRAMEGGR